MITMTCKCKSSQMTFHKLSQSDFPKGWENECCSKVSGEEPKLESAAIESTSAVEVVEMTEQSEKSPKGRKKARS